MLSHDLCPKTTIDENRRDLRILSPAFVRSLPSLGFASAMTLEMSLAANDLRHRLIRDTPSSVTLQLEQSRRLGRRRVFGG